MNTFSCFIPSRDHKQYLIKFLILGILLTVGFSTIAQPGLVAHYPFNGTFTDQTANGNHAIPAGNPTFGTDRNGVANHTVSLGGCGNLQFIRVPNSASLQVDDAMTIMFWANVDLSVGMDPGTGTCNEMGRQVFFAKGGDGYGVSPPGFLGLTYPADGQQYLTFEANAGQSNVQFSKELPGNTWHHYAYVLTTTEIKLYMDAQLVHTSPASVSFEAANQQDLYLGVMGPKSSPVLGVTSWYPLNGAMDDVRIFNRRLDATEVSLVYASDDAGSCAPAASILPAESQTICDGQSITLKGVPPSDVQVKWLKDGQPIAQATLDSLVVSQAGSYRIETARRQDAWKSEIGGFKTTMNDIQFVGGNYGWIVGDYGLLLKTTNGYSWDTIYTGRQNTFTSVNFVNTQVGFIGGANGLLLKTTDGAASFSQLSLPVSGPVQKIKFLNENTGYILADRLLFKSTNGGTSWTTVTLPNTFGLEDIAFVDADFGWIASRTQIYKTDDGGISWVLQKDIGSYCSDSFVKFQKLWALNRSNCWALYYNECNGGYQNPNFVLKTPDGGSTWESHNVPISAFFSTLSYIIPKAIIFTDAQNGFIVGSAYKRVTSSYGANSGVVYRTENGGQTWTIAFDNPYNASPIAIAFKSPSQGYVVGNAGLMLNISTSGDAYLNPFNRTFLPLRSVGGTFENVFAVGGVPRLAEYGAHPDSKAVTMSKSQEENWVKAETGFPNFSGYTLSQVKFKTKQFGWKVGYATMSITQDGGNSWQSIFRSTDPRANPYLFNKAYFKSDSIGFVLIKYNEFNPATLSGFSGTSRTSIDIPYIDPGDPSTTGMLDLQFIDDNTGFITTSNGKLIKTTDGGTSWSVLLVRANTALNRCYFVTTQIGWVVGANGLIMKTTNGGQSWITQNSGSTANWNGIHFLSAQEGYVVGTRGTLLKTSDGGNSWVSIVTNTHNTLNDITFTTRDKGYIVGDYGTILAFDPTLLPDCKATSAAVNVSVTPGTVCETAASGSWDNAGTWGCGHVPMVCDQVAINPGHVVTLSQSVQVRGIEIRQNGQLSTQGRNVMIQN